MKKQYDVAARMLGILTTLLSGGCEGPVAPELVLGPSASNGGSGSGGRDGSSGSTGRGGRPNTIETLPGVDTALDVPPAGCLGGFAAGALSLELNAEVPSVRISAVEGKLLANGVACTDASDAELSLESLDSLSVTGNSVQENAVILELGSGDWSRLMGTPESIQVSLGQGENSLVVLGTSGPDLYHHGMRGLDLVLDLTGGGRIAVVAQGVTELGVSLGEGDDRLDDLALLLAPPAAEGSGAEPAATATGGSLAVLPLSVRLVANGGPGNDWLLGGSADDAFDPGPGDDVASGLTGDDTFLTADTSDGADIFNGALGYDTVSYELRSNAVVLDVCLSEAVLGCSVGECDCAGTSGESGESDRLLNVEDITGGAGDDILRGSDAAESLSGGVGDDSLYGLGGSDILYGQLGDDLFDGGPDGDYCDAQPEEQTSGCEL
jgi:hypothetical protein